MCEAHFSVHALLIEVTTVGILSAVADLLARTTYGHKHIAHHLHLGWQLVPGRTSLSGAKFSGVVTTDTSACADGQEADDSWANPYSVCAALGMSPEV